MSVDRYEPPRLLASYSIAELREDAAAEMTYVSDARLKTEFARVERPLERLRRLARA